MKTVRFSKVVEKCGKPEVYLLMTETDPDFQKALHADRIMSLSDDSHGAGTEYGTIGYDKKRKGQLLMFHKTVKAFKELKVVGIKYDLFAEDEPSEPTPKKKAKGRKGLQKAKERPVKKVASEKVRKRRKQARPKSFIFPNRSPRRKRTTMNRLPPSRGMLAKPCAPWKRTIRWQPIISSNESSGIKGTDVVFLNR